MCVTDTQDVRGDAAKGEWGMSSERLCEVCGEPIPAKRLEAVPNARRCVVCQSQNDVVVLRDAAVPLHRLTPSPREANPTKHGIRMRRYERRGLLSSGGLSQFASHADPSLQDPTIYNAGIRARSN